MDDADLRKLIYQWLEGSIGSNNRIVLAAELRESEHARGVFLAVMAIHAELVNTEDARQYLSDLAAGDQPDEAQAEPGSGRSIPSHRKLSWPLLSLAAALLIAVGLLSISRMDKNHLGSDQGSRPVLAELSPISADCEWYVEQSGRSKSITVYSKDVVRATKGRLAVEYPNGVSLELASPAAYELLSNTQARLLIGRITVEVSEAGKGFSVVAPQATIVDLGTRFSVSVESDGATDIVVIKGEVDIDYSSGHAESSGAQRLQMGEAVRVDAAGTASRLVSIRNNSFSSQGDDAASQVVIEEVRDNIDRMSSLNFYEIVHRGMQEDALAFVDREAHQWNGIDESGMPRYLVGGDYVKTFNNDKFNHSIRVQVNVAVPSNLYVLFDNRLPVPSWLSTEFQDTGDDIGLDVGRFFSRGQWHNKGPSGIGPGESVEDTFSVWVKRVEIPSIVALGATEAPKSEPNMYGIVAVPLEASKQE